MDKLFNKIGILLAGVAFFALFSCEENSPDGPDVPDVQLKIDLSTRSVTIPAEGGSFPVTATIPVSWEVTASDSWFSVSPSRGEAGAANLVFGADKNESGETRTGTATVSAEGLQSVSITVSQASVEVVPPVPDTELSVSPERLSFSADAGSATFNITANKDWTVSAGNASWLAIDKASGSGNASIQVSVTKNTVQQERSAVITVVSEEKTVSLTVVQAAAEPDPDDVGIGGGVNDWGDGNDLGFEGNN